MTPTPQDQMRAAVVHQLHHSAAHFPAYTRDFEIGGLTAVTEFCVLRSGRKKTAELLYQCADRVVAELPLEGLHPAAKAAEPRGLAVPEWWPMVAVPLALTIGLLVGAAS